MPLRRLHDTLADRAGNALYGVSITVTVQSSGNAAALFHDSAGTQPVLGPNGLPTNILTTDPGGEYACYVADDIYRLSIYDPRSGTAKIVPDLFIGTGGQVGAGTGDVVSGTSATAAGQLVAFKDSGAKTLDKVVLSGLAKLTSGVISAAVAETDYVTPGGAGTLTNKTLAAPVITGIALQDGATIIPAATVVGNPGVIDISKGRNRDSVSAAKSYVFSGTPTVNGHLFGLHVSNTSASPVTLTVPTSADSDGSLVNSVILPALTTFFIDWMWEAGVYTISGHELMSGGAGVTDGDKGGIIVTGGGASWTVKNGSLTTAKYADASVTLSKVQALPSAGVLGGTAAGPVGLLSFAAVKSALGISAFTETLLDDPDAATWRASLGVGSGSGDVTGPSSAVDGEVVLMSGTSGKSIKRGNTLTGMLKATAGVLAPADAIDWPGFPVGGARLVSYSASTGARQNRVRASGTGKVTGNGSVATVECNANHQMHSGMQVLCSCPNPANAFDAQVFYGTITYVDAKTFTVPYSGASGTSGAAWDVLMQQRWSHSSEVAVAEALLGGAVEMVANLSTGSNNLSMLVQRLPLVLSLKPRIVYGNMGVPNSITNLLGLGQTIAQTVAAIHADMVTVLNGLSKAGAVLVYDSPPCSLSATADSMAAGIEVEKDLRDLFRQYPGTIYLDTFALTSNPATGIGYADLFRGGGDDVHRSKLGSDVIGAELARLLQPVLPAGASQRNLSISDRRSASTFSATLSNWGRSATGQNPNVLDARLSGTVYNEITVGGISDTGGGSGSGGATAVFSLEPVRDADGTVLHYDQYVTFTGVANDILTFVLTGASGSLMKDMLEAGKSYSGWVDHSISSSGNDVVRSYAIDIAATMNYGLGSITGVLASAMTNLVDNPERPLRRAYSGTRRIPRFTIPAGLTGTTLFGVSISIELNATGSATLRFAGDSVLRKVP